MRTNVPVHYSAETHEGGAADPHQRPEVELERAVATCLLFENTFYEEGSDLAGRIEALCAVVDPARVADLAVRTRESGKLRHVPLFLCRQLARRGALKAETLAAVIRRPDEITEFLALYWKDNGKRSLPAQVKKGLALAFQKFGEYQLAKWNRGGAVKLRDALFLSHAKPKDEEQAALWRRLVENTLATPDTWEVAISAATTPEEKAAAWGRLLSEQRLGQMALLSNLRNLLAAGIEPQKIGAALVESAKAGKALPFRFLSALKAAPQLAAWIEEAMLASIDPEPIGGDTLLVIDVSGSMDVPISGRSTLLRWEAAAAVGVLLREVCRPSVRIFTFSNDLVEVAAFRGLALVHSIGASQHHSGTALAQCLSFLWGHAPKTDRIIVITDEQARDGIVPVEAWAERAYVVNVAAYKPALLTAQNGWTRINGWSESVVDWMRIHERGEA